MNKLIWALLALALASCGREAPLKSPPGTLFDAPTFIDESDSNDDPFGAEL